MTATLAPQPTPPSTPPRFRTAAEWLHALGDVPPERVLMYPPPGTATEADVVRWVDGDDKRLVELVDGTLVEKPVGHRESLLAGAILVALKLFVTPRKLGLVYTADAMLRMTAGNVRLPDVTFAAWADVPGRRVPKEPVAAVAPTLAVEILSESNTRREMQKKRREYFASGGRLVWEVDPDARTVAVFGDPGAPDTCQVLTAARALDGAEVLPGFTLPLADLFAELDQSAD